MVSHRLQCTYFPSSILRLHILGREFSRNSRSLTTSWMGSKEMLAASVDQISSWGWWGRTLDLELDQNLALLLTPPIPSSSLSNGDIISPRAAVKDT